MNQAEAEGGALWALAYGGRKTTHWKKSYSMTPKPTASFPALVMAGGSASAEFAVAAGLPSNSSRALADICGKPMVEYVLEALRDAESISRTILVAPSSFPTLPSADVQIPADGDLPDNIRKGMDLCGDSEFVLIVTADIPFLTPSAVDDYVAVSVATRADCCYAAIPKESCVRSFPEMKRTYLRAVGGSLTGGNVVFQRIATYDRQSELLREAYRRRKSPAFLARLIGLGNLVKFAFDRLTVGDIERAASRLMEVRTRLIVTPHAELGTDVDRPEDLALARKFLTRSPQAPSVR